MNYGQKPKILGNIEIISNEMFFYQYLPIKMYGDTQIKIEDRLSQFNDIVGMVSCDFVADFGLERFRDSYMYLTAKNLFVSADCNFNRGGWHSDGFMTDDINYIWSDFYPTEFVFGDFEVIQDDLKSLVEFDFIGSNNKRETYIENCVLRLNQFVIHRCGKVRTPRMRQFVKISFSKDKYDLIGNSHNYLFDYKWEMRKRNYERNIPQKL